MDWKVINRGQGDWLRGEWTVDLGDRSSVQPQRASKVVWFRKGVLEIYLNVYEPVRLHIKKSRRSIGKALQGLFGTGNKWICDVSDGRFNRKRGWIATNVVWYAPMAERPAIELIERVYQTVVGAIVEETYEAVVVKTGEEEYYTESELPYSQCVKGHIRRVCTERSDKVVNGRRWRFVG